MADQMISYANLVAIENSLATLANMSAGISSQVDQLATQQVQVAQTLDTLVASFQEFVRKDMLHKEVHLAETRIVRVRQELEAKFGHYGEVRRRATGILQGLDVNLVSSATLQATTEDVMMKTPGYWLAPVLVALAAWNRNDRSLAERALAEALRRDDFKTSLFFALTCRRISRPRPSSMWLHRYFAHQNPEQLDREFVVLLDAVAGGLFGPDGRIMTTRVIDTWLVDLASRADFVPQQERRWADALRGLKPSLGRDEFKILAEHSPTWPALSDAMTGARLHTKVDEFFHGIFDGELVVSPRLATEIDSILDSLVTNFDDEELPMRRNERLLQLIIDKGGDKDEAQAAFDGERKSLDEKVTFTELLTNSAMHPELAKASQATRRWAVALSKDWVVAAYDTVAAEERSKVPLQVDVKLGEWTGTTENGSEEDRLRAEYEAHVEAKKQAALASLGKPMLQYAALALAAAFFVYGVVSGSFLLGLVVLAGAAGWALVARSQVAKNRTRVISEHDEIKTKGTAVLRAALAEVVDYRREWVREDSRAEVARASLQAISPEQFTMSHSSGARAVLS